MTAVENKPPTALKTGDVVEVGNRKEANRQIRGIFIGLILATLVWSIFPEGAVDSVNATYGTEDTNYTYASMRLTAAVAVLMAAWWVTEAIPLAITALLPLIIFPIAQIIPFETIASPFASLTIFLFMGGFILALGLQRWNLHRRLALHVILLVGTKPKQMIAGFMLATALLSMWVSNTATAVVMLPIGTSVLALTAEVVGGHKNQKKFASGLMLAIAYSASIASVSTIISTPPNAMLAAYMASTHGIEIGFAQWMMVGLPLAMVFLVLAWLVLTTVFKPEMTEIPGGKEMIRAELAKMGPMTLGEKLTGAVFLGAALSWVFLPFIFDWIGANIQIADAAIGLTASALLFLIPVNRGGTRLLDWKSANKLPWDVLLLFGGGLALSRMFTESGLSLWIGELASGFGGLPTIILIFVIAVLVLVLTEFTSNTATAATFLPIMGGVAVGMGLTEYGEQNVLLLILPVVLCATCSFMLPVATPPNAIAFASGYVRIGDMLKGGFWLNVIALFLVTLTTYFIAVPVFGLVLP
ncbi:DASS family sodium-coupled anion symporter [Corynebacterium hylobatis]|uniref:Sodium-dependent dicarboxylate transporter SdcS n=1 Tax=Corynebacterium hylobatis TaxID=1859290 RepID=A0A3R9ZEQ8_9CORY|nr:DASS family sodium-coupled anion symporter [Corynebacterium hylobatis]RSZ64681.1 DASS family sodium-coupled anion symporter [Corynebacterium hylobatis]